MKIFLLFNPQISPQRNRLRPDEIGLRISLGKHFTGQADYPDEIKEKKISWGRHRLQ